MAIRVLLTAREKNEGSRVCCHVSSGMHLRGWLVFREMENAQMHTLDHYQGIISPSCSAEYLRQFSLKVKTI